MYGYHDKSGDVLVCLVIEALVVFTVMLKVEPVGRGFLDVENPIKAGAE